MRQDVAVAVHGRSTNTSTNPPTGFSKPITLLEVAMETTHQTYLPTIKTQPTSCGLVNTRPTAVVTNGQDTVVTGTMLSHSRTLTLTGSDRAFLSVELFRHLGYGALGSVDATTGQFLDW